MQATIRFINTIVFSETKNNYSQNLRTGTIALVGALFLSAAIPIAGNVNDFTLEDSSADLNLSQITQEFKKSLPKSKQGDAYKLAKLVMEMSVRHQISPGLILSVIETESSFRSEIVSSAGAIGLMQLLPSTALEVAHKYKIKYQEQDLFDPTINIKLGVAYLAYLRGRFGSSTHYLAAYNLGPSAMKNRLQSGNYSLGVVENYVRKIQNRTIARREKQKNIALPLSMMREANLLAASQ